MDNASESSFGPLELSTLYPEGIEHHYWNSARNKFFLREIGKRVSREDGILEIGCGTGIVKDFLISEGFNVYGCDLCPAPPRVNNLHRTFYSNDFENLPGVILSRIKAVILADVIEHLHAPEEFLKRISSTFPSLEFLFISVPARNELWSNFDVFNKHMTRYSLSEIVNLVRKVPYEVEFSKYIFQGLYIPCFLQIKLFGQRNIHTVEAPKSPFKRIVHGLFSEFLFRSSCLLPRKVYGSSIFLVASLKGRVD